jgi:hypothetical protein
MPKFSCLRWETNNIEVTIEAKNAEEAEAKFWEMYEKDKLEVDIDDSGFEIEEIKE